jgi:hypothetical protein
MVLIGATIVSGCETSSTISTGPNPVKCVVSLASPPVIGADGGTESLAVTTQPECRWDAASNVNWISGLSPASGQGAATLSFRVSPNAASSPREGTIVVNGEQARVSQRAQCRYEVTPTSQNIGSSGGSLSATITTAAECAWTATADVNWITLTPPVTGAGTGRVTFAVRLNDGAQRTGTITIAGQRSSVTQASSPPPPPPPPPSPPAPPPPPACSYSISPTSDNVTANDGAGTVNVTATPSTCTWTAVSNAAWLTVAAGTRTGNGSVDYRVGLNLGPPRTGTITIAGRTFTVIQASIIGSSSPR